MYPLLRKIAQNIVNLIVPLFEKSPMERNHLLNLNHIKN
jgi:hypothetical protein